MANITPVVSNSQALITPGYPLASVPQSNPLSQKAITATANLSKTADVIEAADRATSLTQSGHQADRV